MQTLNPESSDTIEGLTTREAAHFLRRSTVTLERWRRLRRGPPFFTLMGRVRYDRADLLAWVEAQKQATERRHDEVAQ